jgi:hypothetical protein
MSGTSRRSRSPWFGGMPMRNHPTVVPLVQLFSALLFASSVALAISPVRNDQGVTFVTGGAGTEERNALEALGHDFNLKLTMALNDGHFVGDVTVRIRDANGRTVLDTVAKGPLLYAKLDPGTYGVSCSMNGKNQEQTAHVEAKGQEQVKCTWPSE